MKKLIGLLVLIISVGCHPMQGQRRLPKDEVTTNYWIQEYVQKDGKWVKNGEPFIAPDTMKIYGIWKQR